MTQNNNILTGKIKGFEKDLAIIAMAENLTIKWPIKNLPPGIEVGSACKIILTTAENQADDQEKIAKTILNEILQNDENKK